MVLELKRPDIIKPGRCQVNIHAVDVVPACRAVSGVGQGRWFITVAKIIAAGRGKPAVAAKCVFPTILVWNPLPGPAELAQLARVKLAAGGICFTV